MQIGFHLTPFWSPTDRSPTQIIDEMIEVVRAASAMGYAWVSVGQHWTSYPTIWPQPFPIIAVYRYIALQNTRKTDEATAMADTWMREHPKDTTLRVFLAEQSLRKKDYRGAATQFRTALEIEPDNPVILNNLASALIEVDDPKSAEIAEKAYVQAPGNPNVIDTLGWALVQTGDANKGLELLRTASNLAPANEEIRLHLARALIKTRDPVGAKKELETLAKTGKSGTIRSDAEKLLSSL